MVLGLGPATTEDAATELENLLWSILTAFEVKIVLDIRNNGEK